MARLSSQFLLYAAALVCLTAGPAPAAVQIVPIVSADPVPQPNGGQAQQDIPADSAPAPEPPPKSPDKPPADDIGALPKNVTPVSPAQAISVLGKKVRGPDGKDVVGSIIDILIDDQGKPRAAIIDFGGFLGVGSRKIAVDWQLLSFHPADGTTPVILNLDRTRIQAAPEYKDPTQPAEVVEPSADIASPTSEGIKASDGPAQPDAEHHTN